MSQPSPFHFLLAVYAGWVNRHQLAVIQYPQAEHAHLEAGPDSFHAEGRCLTNVGTEGTRQR